MPVLLKPLVMILLYFICAFLFYLLQCLREQNCHLVSVIAIIITAWLLCGGICLIDKMLCELYLPKGTKSTRNTRSCVTVLLTYLIKWS